MDENFYKTYFELEKNNWWFKVRREIIFWLLNKHNSTKGKILDYGCGSGFLVKELQDGGLDAYGIDVSLPAIQLGKSRNIKNLFKIDDIKVDMPDNHFDTLLALDVVEHLENDSAALEEFHRLLKPGGLAVITVPAYQWMWGVQDEISHHFRRYTMRQLVNLIGKNPNFKILKKSYFNTFLFPPIALVRVLSQILKTKRESDFEMAGNLMNKVLYFIFHLESKLIRYFNFPFGVSILLIIKKERDK